jgi:hypothetical protein
MCFLFVLPILLQPLYMMGGGVFSVRPSKKKLLVSSPRLHAFSLPHGFFFFLCCIFKPFKEFPLGVLVYYGHFSPFGIVRLLFGNFRQLSRAVRYFTPAVCALLLFWRHIA